MLDVTFLARLITLTLDGAPFPHPDRALPLLLGTAATESHLIYARQVNGPARSYWQIEPATEADCWTNYLSYRRHLVQVFVERCGEAWANVHALEHNLVYGILLARLVYFRAPEALPAAYDLEGQARYWKAHYNTPRGKGTVEQYLEDWQRLVAPSWPGQGEGACHAD